MNSFGTPTNQRILVLDVLRGIALFGILLANMASFKTPLFQQQSLPSEWTSLPDGPLNQWAAFGLEFFVVGNFYPLFSLLFGIGFYLFYERSRAKGRDARRLYKRRLTFLLIIGGLHLFFIWSGDILHTYAITGFLLLFFINKKTSTILAWSISLIIISMVVLGALVTWSSLLISTLTAGDMMETAEQSVHTAVSIYSSGTYIDILSFRLENEVPAVLSNLFINIPNILGLFLLGVYMAKKGLFHHTTHYKHVWKRILIMSGLSGGTLSLFYASLQSGILTMPSWLSYGLASGLNISAGPLWMLFYVAFIVLISHNTFVIRMLQPFAAAGRMSLTNYLLQSIIATFVFYGYGLGLFASVSVFSGVLIGAGMFLLQIGYSWIWLKYQQQGPFEKWWRRWTYPVQ
ncbi:uncharacterized protein SAMN05192534_11639 [Alteribacillus persepolensis]|uniref:DUF418 domain-containing protein n=1 Tax=Alteribacillus persepolensis TaxID=568899 RepID=A0A1G8GLT4_9BACI|nr:DUF418 domain-containing protein [Alteribacillus persepolensis]SDH95368.1 uncharacterized protein SAMN05192534_11639 [Alteribacillus persepolensis]